MIPTEIELKFIAPPGSREVVERHPKLVDVPPSHERLVSTYFDTPSCILRSRGLSLRVRQGGHGWTQTLKGTGAFGPRDQWEWALQSDEPDFSRLAEARLDDTLVTMVAKQGRPLFVTDIERTERVVQIEGTATIAAAIDDGVVRSGNNALDIHEVELELKHGSLAAAFQLAIELVARAPLRINPCSKADRGFSFLTGKAEAAKAQLPELSRDITVAESFPILVNSALRQFVANIPAAETDDAEGVHQMRVALRRLRTLFVLFAPEIEPCTRRRLSDVIRSLGMPLGEARDWDVFIGETLHDAQSGVPADSIAAFREAARERQDAAHSGVKELIAGPKPTQLVLAVGAWVAGRDWVGIEREAPSRPLKPVSRRLLGRVARKVRKRGRDMPELYGTGLHALRKAMKKLRYSVEYTRSLYGRRRAEDYRKSCKKLQSQLGTINDGAVTAKLIERIVPGNDALWAVRAGELMAWNQDRTVRAHKAAGRAWRRFRKQPPFWNAG